jgi:EmrB/QacA subfamily drug resistance transporter
MKDNKGVIILLFVGVLMGALDISIVGPALPSIENALKIDARYIGWIFSIYVLFNLIGISLFARLSDVYGRRRIYIIALSIFAIGSLWVSVARSFDMLLIGRAIQGFGASGIFPVASALVGDLFPPQKRGQILGLIGAVFGLAFLIGPFVAGVMLNYLPWNFLFIINLPISVILIYYSSKILPNITNINVIRIDWLGIISLGIALAAFTYGLNNLKGLNWEVDFANFKMLLPFIVSIVALIILFSVENKAKNPIIEFSFFKNREIMIAGIIAVVTGVVQACFVFIPKFVVETFNVTPSTASFMLTPFVLATAIGSPIFGKMIDKFGVKIIIGIGLIISTIGFYLLAFNGNNIVTYYLSGSVIGLGLSVLSGSSLRYIMLNNTSLEDRATSQGMLTIFISIGQLIGTAAVGLLTASLVAKNLYEYMFFGVACLLMAMFVISFGLKNVVYEKK